jgi:mannosyltransferase OCH1-like enzyme
MLQDTNTNTNTNTKFQKNIYIVWYQGEKNITNKQYIENIKNWKLLNPTWNVKIIDNIQLRNACKLYSKKCLELYDSFNIMHMKIDLGRYVLLYLYGGIYVDMDMYCIRSLDYSNILKKFLVKQNKYSNILGLSEINLSIYESYISIGKPQFVNNAMMISTRKHPFLKRMINNIIKHFRAPTTKKLQQIPAAFRTSTFENMQLIDSITGPQFLNKYYEKYTKRYKTSDTHIEIFPYYIFEPATRIYMELTNDTLAIHQYELSWQPKEMKFITYFYFKFNTLIILFFLLTIMRFSSYWRQMTLNPLFRLSN